MARAERVIYRDKTSGRAVTAQKAYVDWLLTNQSFLEPGIENAKHVRDILIAMGHDYTDDKNGSQFMNDSRQLRDAKEYLVASKVLLIVSSTGDNGGYFYPANFADVQPDIEMSEAMAAGHLRRARELREFAMARFGSVPVSA